MKVMVVGCRCIGIVYICACILYILPLIEGTFNGRTLLSLIMHDPERIQQLKENEDVMATEWPSTHSHTRLARAHEEYTTLCNQIFIHYIYNPYIHPKLTSFILYARQARLGWLVHITQPAHATTHALYCHRYCMWGLSIIFYILYYTFKQGWV